MPSKKKQGGRTNKKKKGQQASHAAASRNQDSAARRSSSGGGGLKEITSNLPTFHNKKEDGTVVSRAESSGGYYEIYKRSTIRFWEWMKQTLPGSKMDAVNDLRKGADLILEQNIQSLDNNKDHQPPDPIVAPQHIMDDLATSIQYRKLLTETKYGEAAGDGDRGHQYMIGVLRHCRSVLRFGRRVARVAMEDSQTDSMVHDEEKDYDGIGGRFNALLLLEEEDEDEEEEDAEAVDNHIRERNFPTFTPPEAPEEDFDIQRVLINGDDRFQAIALLRTMEDLMMAVDQHFGLLKSDLRGQTQRFGSSSIQLLMECTVVANMATESIQVAENALAASYPHLSSFYHVLGLIFFADTVADLEKLIVVAKLKEQPHLALQFVAEIIRCSFHNRGHERIPGRIKRFAKKSGLGLSSLETFARQIFSATAFETQLAIEKPLLAQLNASFEGTSFTPHSWLQQNAHIGGDRCILNTHKIIQMLMDQVQDHTKLIGRPGFWGKPFDEQRSPAARIRGDLDEAFAGNILPELIEICKQAPFQWLPERSQLITVLDLLQQHIKKDRTSPVPVALTFGLHALLTSIFVLQGDGDLARMASYSKQSYNKLFAQLEDLSDQSKPPENAPNFYMNVGNFKNLAKLAEPVPVKYDSRLDFIDTSVAERLAFWNPLIGGEYMLYGTYICSIGLGSATVDSMGQLRFTLHLYNALKQHQPNLNVPFLQVLDVAFSRTKAVWVAGRDIERGSFAKHFWMAWGMSVAKASEVAFGGKDGDDAFSSFFRNQTTQRANDVRDLDEIHPEEYSVSYRRLVLRDLAGAEGVATYTIRNGTKETRKDLESLADLLVRVNMTRDAMDDDDSILPVNFSVVSAILLEFTNRLSEQLEWDAIIDKAIATYPEELRTGKTLGGRQMKPGGFSASDLNLKRQGMAHFWGSLLSKLDRAEVVVNDSEVQQASKIMIDFFQAIPKERYTFLVEHVENPKSVTKRNPLEGSYPRGRTGKTPRDPLQGFCHFKYSKAGSPVVRFIKPGKYTPFHPTGGGDVSTPYVEKGSKMKREASGKYRHIASYSMEELVALGWDGAMYISKQGRHAASGHYVPFVVGYDSDADDDYEPINVQAGKRAGIIGLPHDENGLFMEITGGDGRLLVQIKDPTR